MSAVVAVLLLGLLDYFLWTLVFLTLCVKHRVLLKIFAVFKWRFPCFFSRWLPRCAVVKNLPANAGDAGLGKFCGEGNGTPLQYSGLEIPWTVEPEGRQSTGSKKVVRDWAHAWTRMLYSFILFYFFLFFFICSEFCHTLEWNSHGHALFFLLSVCWVISLWIHFFWKFYICVCF